jgi:hypothetical protein
MGQVLERPAYTRLYRTPQLRNSFDFRSSHASLLDQFHDLDSYGASPFLHHSLLYWQCYIHISTQSCSTSPYHPGTTSGDVITTIKEGLDAAKLDKRGGLTATQRFERSWNGAVLLAVYGPTYHGQTGTDSIVTNNDGSGKQRVTYLPTSMLLRAYLSVVHLAMLQPLLASSCR